MVTHKATHAVRSQSIRNRVHSVVLTALFLLRLVTAILIALRETDRAHYLFVRKETPLETADEDAHELGGKS